MRNTAPQSWTLERALFAIAGVVTLATLGVGRRSPRWRAMTATVAANLVLYSAVGWCPTSSVLRHAGLRPAAQLAVES